MPNDTAREPRQNVLLLHEARRNYEERGKDMKKEQKKHMKEIATKRAERLSVKKRLIKKINMNQLTAEEINLMLLKVSEIVNRAPNVRQKE